MMSTKMSGHIISLVLVSFIAAALVYLFKKHDVKPVSQADEKIQPYLNMDFIDYNDPMQQALFKDMLKIYQADTTSTPESILRAILDHRRNTLENEMRTAHTREILDLTKLKQLGWMYFKFILVFIVVLLLTYYGVETLGLLRFIRKKQGNVSYLYDLILCLRSSPAGNIKTFQHILSLVIKAMIRGLFYFIFFSPAYVLAYSFKTEFNTNTTVFLALLGFVSNGLLITYTNKFFSFLTTESRKGYVLTALVKNLSDDYRLGKSGGISIKALFSIRKRFRNHVLNHIYLNAHYQYLGTFKEQASFLISGLIIIEMALNIHGHLSYELLQQLMYKNHDLVIVIILSIFIMVKLIQIGTDWIIIRNNKIFNNEKLRIKN